MQQAISIPAENRYRTTLLNIGVNIKYARKANNLSQENLAFECQMEKSAISRIEAGKKNVNFFTLYKIARALSLSVTELIGDAEPLETLQKANTNDIVLD